MGTMKSTLTTKRKIRYAVAVFENGKWQKTNWVGAYKNDKLNAAVKTTPDKYTSISDLEIAEAALKYARYFYPDSKYKLVKC